MLPRRFSWRFPLARTGLVNFILALLALMPIAPTLTDWFAIKRWFFADRAWLAAIFANLAALAVGIPLFLALQWVNSEAATALELWAVDAAYWLRTLSPWLEGLVTITAMAATKAPVLRGGGWRPVFAAGSRTSFSVDASRHVGRSPLRRFLPMRRRHDRGPAESSNVGEEDGAARGNRTPDPVITNDSRRSARTNQNRPGRRVGLDKTSKSDHLPRDDSVRSARGRPQVTFRQRSASAGKSGEAA